MSLRQSDSGEPRGHIGGTGGRETAGNSGRRCVAFPQVKRPIAGIGAGQRTGGTCSASTSESARLRRSSLKERGRVKALVTSDLGGLRPRRTRRDRRRGQGSGGARPRSGRKALRLAPGSTNNVGGGDSSGAVLRSQNGLAVRSSRPGSRLGGRPGWAAGHPYAAAGAA